MVNVLKGLSTIPASGNDFAEKANRSKHLVDELSQPKFAGELFTHTETTTNYSTAPIKKLCRTETQHIPTRIDKRDEHLIENLIR